MGQLVIETDSASRVLWASPGTGDLLDLEPAQLSGRPLQSLVHPDDVDRIVGDGGADQGSTPLDEFRLRRRDGEYIWVKGSRAALSGPAAPGGSESHRVLALVDVDDLIRERDQLALEHGRAALVLENTSDAILLRPVGAPLEWVAPSIRSVLGYSPSELMGAPFVDLVHTDDRLQGKAFSERVEELALQGRMGESHASTLRIRNAAGEYRWIASRVRPVVVEGEDQPKLVAVWRDVTEEHLAKEALVASEEHFQRLAENVSDVMAFSDRNRSVTWISPSVERVLGWTPGELVGTVLGDLLHPDDWVRTESARVLVYSGERSPLGDDRRVVRMRRKAGDYRWVSVASAPVCDPDGEPLGVVTSLTDVDELVHAREQAQQERKRLQATIDALLDPFALLEPVRDAAGDVIDFACVLANGAAGRVMGRPREDLDGARVSALLPGGAVQGLIEACRVTLASGTALVMDGFPVEFPPGEGVRRYDIRATAASDVLSVIWREVTHKHREQEALAASEEAFRLLAMNSSEVIVRTRQGQVLWASPSLERMLGWTPQEWEGRNLTEFLPVEQSEQLVIDRARMVAGETVTNRYTLRGKDGQYHWVQTRAKAFTHADGTLDGVVSTFHTIDDVIAAESEMIRLATTDQLTGFLNRGEAYRRIGDILGQTQRTGQEIGVAFCDVDHFKEINDAYGHSAGDLLLRAVAQRVVGALRADDVVSRIGGDEFVIFLNGVHDLDEAVQVADKVRQAVSLPLPFGRDVLRCTLSVGVALVGADADVEGAVERADQAMYQAKMIGRDGIATSPD